jgi:hypothetical protein
MNEAEFLALDQQDQNGTLLKMARNALAVLSDYPTAMAAADKSLQLVQRFLNGEDLTATEICQFLDDEDMGVGLGLQIYNVEDDPLAIAAIDLACYATGAASKAAFEQQDLAAEMPAPVSEAVPEVVVDGIKQYRILQVKGLVPEI